MRAIIGNLCIVLMIVAASRVCEGQTPQEGYAEERIATSLRTGSYEGFLTKMLRLMGDQGAVAVAKVISDRPLSDSEFEFVLSYLHDSFSDVSLIHEPSNREPRVALLVLRYLECSTKDPGRRREIEETRRSLPALPVPPVAK